MAKLDLTMLRNIGVIAHIDAGKTTTTEHLLYYSGAVHRLGGVDEGTTETDWMELEREKGITIQSACVPFQWQGHTVNLIDTPGHVDFTAEVERSLRVLDGCVVVFDAQNGVEAQSETVWRQADKYHVPRLVFINKMDIVGANFDMCMQQIRERLQGRPVPIVIPLGSGSPKETNTPFCGVIDLITMEACQFAPSQPGRPDGKVVQRTPLSTDPEVVAAYLKKHGLDTYDPLELVVAMQRYREQLFDVLTEADDKDTITSTYLEGKPVPVDAVRQLIRQRTLKNEIQPVLCGSGREHIGVQLLLDAICWYLPCPLDRPPVVGKNPKKGTEEKRKPDADEPFAALIFKIQTDPHGELYYLRVYSGSIKANSRPLNPGKNVKEFLTKLYHVHADPRNKDALDAVSAGDIIAAIGPKESITGDTLCDLNHPILLESIHFAETVVSRSIEPETSADKQKLLDTLQVLKREDPTFEWKIDPDTGQTLMSGMGMLHLDVKRHRLEHDFRLKIRVGKPLVSYRETIRKPVRQEGECIKPAAAGGLFAKITVGLAPFRGEQLVAVENQVSFETLPPVLAAAAEQGIRGALSSGEIGYPVINVKATIIAATVDPQLSNEVAFQAAAADAVNQALKNNIVLLEPVMGLEVTVPEDYLGPVTADLNARRAEIDQLLTRGNLRVIEATVPLAKMFDYSERVRSLTQGRASWTMEPKHYAPAPDEVLRGLLGTDDSI